MEVTILFSNIVSFCVGVFVGFWVRHILHQGTMKHQKFMKNLVASVVLLMWSAAMIQELYFSSYTVSPLLHGLMGAIVAYFYKFERGSNVLETGK